MTVRAMVPVDLRPPERANELGNHFGVVLLDLAIRSRQRLQRVLATKANMNALKQSPEPLAALMLFNVLGWVPVMRSRSGSMLSCETTLDRYGNLYFMHLRMSAFRPSPSRK